jgi:hypothetical protein
MMMKMKRPVDQSWTWGLIKTISTMLYMLGMNIRKPKNKNKKIREIERRIKEVY